MSTLAVLMRAPEQLELKRLPLAPPGAGDVVVDIAYSGISTGTERLLWSGKMPSFPGMGYPLVPGYESVGTVIDAGASSNMRAGDRVFVPGARCFGDVRGLFGGAAARVVVPGEKAVRIDSTLDESGVLLALAATAQHALADGNAPELIVGHGVLGRLIARMSIANGAPAPVVWEMNADRRSGGLGYEVIDPETDERRDYQTIFDVSGDASILDTLIGRLARGGEIVLAGFYSDRIAFDFPPAFMREARIRAAAEWKQPDLEHVLKAISDERLSLDGLITHRSAAAQADDAYRLAFNDPSCLKMVLDWRNTQ
ncbi:MAG: chlorophyll synthesis pathway protein BchC [Pseudomonadota bacterium]